MSDKRQDHADEEESESKRQCSSSLDAVRMESSYFSFLFKDRVFVAKYTPGKPLPPPPVGGRNVLIHVKADTLGGALSPYQLKDENGNLLENIWQFSKVYPAVSEQKTPLSRWHPNQIIWSHPDEVHVDPSTDKVSAQYWEWRKKGTSNAYAVRYPNGFAGRRTCLYALWPISEEDTAIAATDPEGVHYQRLDYIAARKKIYCGLYTRLAAQHPELLKIIELLQQGETIQLVEVDGPNVGWYTDTPISYAIQGRSLAISESTIRYLINDSAHPFGHGYVIGALLMGGASWMS